MRHIPNPLLADSWAEARMLGSGCAGCWAAGYCAACSPTSLQPPPACPLTPSDAGRRTATPPASARS